MCKNVCNLAVLFVVLLQEVQSIISNSPSKRHILTVLLTKVTLWCLG